MKTTNQQLKQIEEVRHGLHSRIKDFKAVPPSGLEITVNGSPVRFPIDAASGKVAELPDKGLWGWARNLRWRDLQKFLEKEGHAVRLLRDDKEFSVCS